MPAFTNLEVEFQLITPLALSSPWLFFDSILAHLQYRKTGPQRYRCLDSKVPDEGIEADNEIPLLRNARYGMHHASCGILDAPSAGMTTLYKMFVSKHVGRLWRPWKVRSGIGHFKNTIIRLNYYPCRSVRFYCVGDGNLIGGLLDGLPGLGKKVSAGFGFIKNYDIREMDEDRSIMHEGVAMRPIPVSAIESCSESMSMAYKAPYWAATSYAMCAVPGSLVKEAVAA